MSPLEPPVTRTLAAVPTGRRMVTSLAPPRNRSCTGPTGRARVSSELAAASSTSMPRSRAALRSARSPVMPLAASMRQPTDGFSLMSAPWWRQSAGRNRGPYSMAISPPRVRTLGGAPS